MNSSFIKILPDHIVNKIAAGEVVNRPASVIKELMENSLDAGASEITIVIKEGGKSLIQIFDNGSGMSEGDAVTAFARHSTSKISSYEDLEQLHSFGFRGEALASIAAVAQVEMRTRTNENDVGTLLKIEGGKFTTQSKIATEVGTKIFVQNLFFNTPARKNFLKSNNVEFRHIHSFLQQFAISHSSLRLQFISDDEEIFSLPTQNLLERLALVFGETVADNVLAVNEENPFVSIQGFIGKPTYFRKTRAEQFFFLNKRIIQNKNLMHAVYQGYEHLLEKGSFPFFVLFITIDPKRVDVNVHPSKMEVKFDDEQNMYRNIFSAVRKTISDSSIVPSISLGEQDMFSLQISKTENHFNKENKFFTPTSFLQNFQQPKFLPKENFPFLKNESSENNPSEEKNIFTEFVPLQQLHNQYIIATTQNGIIIIDQHAAHERVLYEKYFASLAEFAAPTQQLLFPLTFDLHPTEISLVQDILPMFEKIGFQLKVFGKNTIVIEGVPADVRLGRETTIFREVLDAYREDEKMHIDARETLIKSFACKAAIKKGDTMSLPEMQSLLSLLTQTKIPHVCPHGRPVTLQITLTELDKKFGRIL